MSGADEHDDKETQKSRAHRRSTGGRKRSKSYFFHVGPDGIYATLTPIDEEKEKVKDRNSSIIENVEEKNQLNAIVQEEQVRKNVNIHPLNKKQVKRSVQVDKMSSGSIVDIKPASSGVIPQDPDVSQTNAQKMTEIDFSTKQNSGRSNRPDYVPHDLHNVPMIKTASPVRTTTQTSSSALQQSENKVSMDRQDSILIERNQHHPVSQNQVELSAQQKDVQLIPVVIPGLSNALVSVQFAVTPNHDDKKRSAVKQEKVEQNEKVDGQLLTYKIAAESTTSVLVPQEPDIPHTQAEKLIETDSRKHRHALKHSTRLKDSVHNSCSTPISASTPTPAPAAASSPSVTLDLFKDKIQRTSNSIENEKNLTLVMKPVSNTVATVASVPNPNKKDNTNQLIEAQSTPVSTATVGLTHAVNHHDKKEPNLQLEGMQSNPVSTQRKRKRRPLPQTRTKSRRIAVQKAFECVGCKRRFPSQDVLARHIAVAHPDDEIYQCKHCQTWFNSKSSFIRHVIINHPKSK